MDPVTRTTRRAGIVAALCLGAVAATGPGAAAGVASQNHRVVLTDGTDEQAPYESDVNASAAVTSTDGTLVVFSTAAPLVPWDTNGVDDVYLRDRGAGTTVLVSHRDGTLGNDYSLEPTISADGRMVAFSTWATNLAGPDRNGADLDVMVKDLRTGELQRVSETTDGVQGNRGSMFPVISGNGRRVAFQSFAALDDRDTDRREDVYVRNLVTGTTRLVSLHPGNRDIRGTVVVGDISHSGRRVAFGNDNNLWVRMLGRGRTVRVWQEPDRPPCQPNPGGSMGRPTISGNGRYVAVSSCATDLPGENGRAADVYRFDLRTGRVVRMHRSGDHDSWLPSLSWSGRQVGFASDASNLVAGDDEGQADAFVADLRTGSVHRASQGPDGTGGNRPSATIGVAISGDGRTLAYRTYADNLVPDDVSDEPEVLVWQR